MPSGILSTQQEALFTLGSTQYNLSVKDFKTKLSSLHPNHFFIRFPLILIMILSSTGTGCGL